YTTLFRSGLWELVHRAHLLEALLPTGDVLVDRHGALEHLPIAGKLVDLIAVDPVAHADAQGVHSAEDVELGERKAGQAVDPRSEAQRHHVQPAAPPGATGGGPELGAVAPEALTDLIVEFGRKGTAADPR